MLYSSFILSVLVGLSSSCIVLVINIPLPETTVTTASATTATTPTTTAASGGSGRKKRSPDDCVQLESLEQVAFQYCPHGNDGFTWEEVQSCEESVQSLPFPVSLPFVMPSKEDFDAIDGKGDGNGILTMGEWRSYVGC